MTAPIARLFDITRLINRAGMHPTGVDRVEVAYLRALIAHPVPFFAVARTALGYVLIDRNGASATLAALDANIWGKPDLISRLNPRLSGSRRLGQSFLRKHAVARCARYRLARMLAAHLPAEFTYLNVGHSNLNTRMFRGVGAARKVVLIHDTIPLDHPDTQASGAADAFATKLFLVSTHADLVICTSTQCTADVTRHLGQLGRIPDIVTAHLGVEVPTPDPAMQCPDMPYFVTVGTIEPRKNHVMLLDIWANWPDAPLLVICGKRGWNNRDVFARLDSHPAQVIEHNKLSDGQIAALVKGAAGMLFPSNAEGFGLPPAEALALGTRVVCASLPVYGEILGYSAVYVAANDSYLWEKAIKKLAASDWPDKTPQYVPPTWDAHFKTVLSKV
jgi:glycosyltransferase involved in cell wall biosynthesis